jgi:DNA polymerase-3 subunit delta'
MFVGEKGIGKKLAAFEFAKILNCSVNDWTETDVGACGRCESCEKILKNIHPDVHFIDFVEQLKINEKATEKTKTILIDTIRYMRKEVETKIHEGKWKFFIIDQADKLEEEASNCILKTLEEPPENTIIILIAKHKEPIMRTILSRSQVLFFQPLAQNEITNWLMLNRSLDWTTAQKYALESEGSIENALKLVDENENNITAFWRKIKTENFYISELLEMSKNVIKSAEGENKTIFAIKYIDALLAEAKKDFRLYPKGFALAVEYLISARSNLLKNLNAQLVLDNLFLDLADLKNKNII